MRRRVTEEEAAVGWPPEHLRHFRAEDWPGKVDPKFRPLAVDCAKCAWYDARDAWQDEDASLDWVLRCCPAWPDCPSPVPRGRWEKTPDGRDRWVDDPPPPGYYHWHPELI